MILTIGNGCKNGFAFPFSDGVLGTSLATGRSGEGFHIAKPYRAGSRYEAAQPRAN